MTAPRGPTGHVDVVVTNPEGDSTRLAEAYTYVLVAITSIVTTLTAAPTLIAPGGQLTVSWVGVDSQPGSRWGFDWIGLYKLGDPNTSFIWYEYVNGATPGTLTVTAPAQPGEYEFRYLPNDGYIDIARSSVVTVETASAVSAIAGEAINGRLPISLPGMFEVGFGLVP